ncbi:uncharacterized protein EAE98_003214 [Botrytis deweyae]|uniref:NADAR domain-containing protein n=1 Tax=Botrytis deweyae TaxID=2478750 RepID=A0ABQ7IW00_9HELO|nr:uncharacterized protein EAE98_003214 [Botrytis deweyae]KAF7935169.1 hypothetical protein EAE98_003214 [Botrytis deweyae]
MAPSPDSHTIFYAKGAEKVPKTALLFGSASPGGEWPWLSNFWDEPFVDDSGHTYRSSENYLQAGKAYMMKDKALFRKLIKYTPLKAKIEGNKMKIDVEKWNQISSLVMADALHFKFRHKKSWIQALVNTGDALIVEAREDMVWGSGLKKTQTAKTRICDWPGQNKLGDELMEIRLKFRELLQGGNPSSGISSTAKVPSAPAVADAAILNGPPRSREPSPVPAPHVDPGTGPAQDPQADENPEPMDLDEPIAPTPDPGPQGEHLTLTQDIGDVEAETLIHNPTIGNDKDKTGESKADRIVEPISENQMLAEEERAYTDLALEIQSHRERRLQLEELVRREEDLMLERQKENQRRRAQNFPVKSAPKPAQDPPRKAPVTSTPSKSSKREARENAGPNSSKKQKVADSASKTSKSQDLLLVLKHSE